MYRNSIGTKRDGLKVHMQLQFNTPEIIPHNAIDKAVRTRITSE
jgi:hypothetical protein